jgi:glycerol-3-phosphate dehydrogenase
MYDVIIIGAGVTGSAVARELMRYDRKVAVLEKGLDVGEGTSKANSGIVHAGFDATPGSLKAKLNVEGSRRMEELSKELDFSYKRNGSLVLCFREEDKDKLRVLYEKGIENGVQSLQILTGEEARILEPNLSTSVVAALYAPTGGIVCPFGLTIALAENACVNGAEFFFDTEVTAIEKK